MRAPFFRLLLITWCVTVGATAAAHAKSHSAPATFPGIEKVNLALRQAWQERRGWRQNRVRVECFVKIDGHAEPVLVEALERAGFAHRSVITSGGEPDGRGGFTPRKVIFTGHLRLRDLPDVAALPFVESIEGAALLGVKQKRKPVSVGK